jgi:polar amino acid transport system permease protein
VTWHWDVIPKNFKYFMMGRLSYAALAWWGLVVLALALFGWFCWEAYRNHSLGRAARRNLFLGGLLVETALLVKGGATILRGIEFLNLGGFVLTMIISVVTIVATFIVGIFVGLMRAAKNPLIRVPSILYIEIIRGGPILMGIFWFYFMLPQVFPKLKGVPQAEMVFATVALIAFYGAYMAETVRAGINSIPHGQMEAALASGLTSAQAFAYIILPQGLKNMIPAIVGNFIAVVKDTSLIYIIGVAEFTRTIFQVNNRVMNAPMELFIFAAVVYFVPCWLLSKWSDALERRLAAGTRRS